MIEAGRLAAARGEYIQALIVNLIAYFRRAENGVIQIVVAHRLSGVSGQAAGT